MDFVDLVHFIIAWEQGEKRQHFKKDAADAPVIHLMVVVTICHQALGWSVPTSTDILSERWLRVDTSTRAEVC